MYKFAGPARFFAQVRCSDALDGYLAGWQVYLSAIAIESGPIRCSTRDVENPASFIQAEQSLPV